MDHDRLFKELLTTFFVEFLELFFPTIAAELDRQSVHFLDKEVFTDISSEARHEVDLLAKVRLSDREAFILIHVENQSTWQADFPGASFNISRCCMGSSISRSIRSRCFRSIGRLRREGPI